MFKPFVATLGLIGVLTYAQDSHAGCGVTLNMLNDGDSDITILQVESKVTVPGAGWSTVGTADFSVGAHKSVSRAYELDLGCSAPRIFRIKYRRGGSEAYATKGPFATAVDRKFDIVIKD